MRLFWIQLLIWSTHLVFAHQHSHEAPHLKYSKEANTIEDEILDEDIIDLPPAHHRGGGDHVEVHGDSHDTFQSNSGCHGHSHGPSPPKLSPEQAAKNRERLHKMWDDEEEVRENKDVWFYALGSTLLISMAPFFILFFIPLDNSKEKQWIMKILLSFASGGLLGDAFLHLIPHAVMSVNEENGGAHSHSHSHSHGDGGHHEPHDLTVGLFVLSGIISFLCVEKLVRIINGGHSHGNEKDEGKDSSKKEEDSSKKEEDKSKKEEDKSKKDVKNEKTSSKKESVSKEKKAVVIPPPSNDIKIGGFLNLAADAFHNFTDGLAIGASFYAGNSIGLITTFTILVHEVPHEIGDFAILVQSGVPRMKAILLQLLTAFGAFLGCLISLLTGGSDNVANKFILPFTAGGFIYIATVSVIPELLEGKSTFKQTLAEISAMLLGVALMVVIAFYE